MNEFALVDEAGLDSRAFGVCELTSDELQLISGGVLQDEGGPWGWNQFAGLVYTISYGATAGGLAAAGGALATGGNWGAAGVNGMVSGGIAAGLTYYQKRFGPN